MEFKGVVRNSSVADRVTEVPPVPVVVVRLLLGLVICEPAPDVDECECSVPPPIWFWLEVLAVLLAACDLLWERGVGGGCCSCWPPPADLPRSNPEELASLAFLRTLGVDGGGRASSLH